jgi:hypothetical protein
MRQISRDVRLTLYRHPILWDHLERQVPIEVREIVVNHGRKINQLVVFECRLKIYDELQKVLFDT